MDGAVNSGTSGTLALTTTSGSLTLYAPVNAGTGAVRLVSTGEIRQNSSGLITGGSLEALTLNNNVGGASIVLGDPNTVSGNVTLTTLNAAGNALSNGQISFYDLDALTIAAQSGGGVGGLEVGVDTGSGASLFSGGAITQASGSSVIAASLTVLTLNDAGAPITLGNAGNTVGLVNLATLNAADTAPAAGAITFVDSTGFSIFGLGPQLTGITTTGAAALRPAAASARSPGPRCDDRCRLARGDRGGLSRSAGCQHGRHARRRFIRGPTPASIWSTDRR